MWILSGAMFPAPDTGVISTIQHWNPIAYAVSAVRRALHGGIAPSGTGLSSASALFDVSVLVAFCAIAACLALTVCYRKR
jgi:ABC-type polysaccharide/polyol phosphate export permease